MSDLTAEKRYREVCQLQGEIRDEQPTARETAPGQAISQLSSGTAPQEKVRKLQQFEARTDDLIGDAAYKELPVSPAGSELQWIDYFSRLDVLDDALEKKRRRLLGEDR